MKKDTHPQYHTKAIIKCACGNELEVGSTLPKIQVDICSHCHPFFTGKQKLVDTARRVEKFQAKADKQEAVAKTRTGKTVKRAALKQKRTTKIAIRKEPQKLGNKRRKAAKDKIKTPDVTTPQAKEITEPKDTK